MDIRLKVGLKIKSIRLQKNLTQEELAGLAGMDRSYISDIERGLRNVSIVSLEKIAHALDKQIFEFFL